MNLFRRFISCAVLMAVAAAGTPLSGSISPSLCASAASKISNPVIWSDVPDEDVIRVGDTYYMVSTTMFFSPGAPIMKSKDLVSWEICGYVYDRLADGDVQNLTNGKHDYAHGQWAASLRYNEKDGKFYVFFGSYGTNKSYIYSTDDIENGEWSKVELNGMYHDASILFDSDGRNYLVYGGGEIKIKEFNSDMTGFKQGGVDRTLFKTNITGYVAGEGSHIQKIGDYYYVFIIAWPSGTGRVEICYRSKDLLGDYEGKTILDSGVGSYGSGVAQGGIVQTPDGDWYGLLFQDHGAVGRIPVLVPVTWQDGWPIMGVNGKAPVSLDISSDGTDLAGDDSFDYSEDKLALEWQWNHNPDNSSWSVTERDGWLRLHNNTIATNLLNARNTLTMRTEGPACSSYIKLDTKGMKAGDYAGLSAFQLNYGNIGVYVADDGTKKVYMAKNGGDSIDSSSNKIIAQQNLQGDEVYLKVDFKFADVNTDGSSSNNIDKANFYYSYDGSDWTKLGEELSMTYDLKLFTGYRSAIYSYPTKNKGGYADIDFFEYDRQTWNGSDGSKKLGSASQTSVPDENGYYFYNTFENSTEKWEGRGSAKVEKSSKAKFNGNSSLYCSGREAAWNGATRSLGSAFKAGQEYSFSVDVMYDEGSSDYELFYLTLQYKGADGTVYYDKIAKGTASKGKWFSLSNTNYKLPEGSSEYQFYVETDNSKTSFYIDDAVGAEAGIKIEAAQKASVLSKGDINFDGCIDVFDLIEARRGTFENAMSESAADVDNSGKFELSDAELIQDFILGKIKEFPDNTPEPETVKFDYNPEIQVHDAPAEYLETCTQAGKVTKETYTGINGEKSLNVYTPYGYDPSKKYNIFYLMHGGGENENTVFSDDVKLNRILDHMIMNNELEPMIVVTPTFNGCPAPDGNMGAGTVWDEMRRSIIPFVEGKYSTYANSTSVDDLKASRYHRAYGGFSMGAGSTWNMLINNLDICAYYMPLSGHCWGGIEGIQNAIDNFGYSKNEYFIFAATGDGDLAYNNMLGLINPMKQDTNHFTYTSDFSKGNFYFMVAPGRTHWWGAVRHYVYDALPYFFHEGQ